jgi:protein O-mannosyl-transferase
VSTASHAQRDKVGSWLTVALIVGLTATAYLPSLGNGFVWDDDVALTRNPIIKSDDGLNQFWLTTQAPDYWPVTATTLWVEWRLWEENATGYHVTNLVLHIVEALLLWRILLRLGVPGALLATLLFAVHPVNVESVAWITQRKNLMAMLFYLLSIYCFVRREKAGTFYWLSLLSFILAMLSKGSVAFLPVVLLGIIAWRRRIEIRDFIRLIPFFFVAGALTLVNIWFQGHHLVGEEVIRHIGITGRILEAGAVVWFYLTKALLPINLTFFYPLWDVRTDDFLWWLPLLAALGLTAILWRCARRPSPSIVIPGTALSFRAQRGISLIAAEEIPRSARNDRVTGNDGMTGREFLRGALFAWGYFCVALIPVMGFTDVYFMKFSLVADHYQHLALIGVTTLAGAGWAGMESKSQGPSAFNFQRLKVVIAALVVGTLAALTWRQCRLYRDAETLYRATIERNPGSWMARDNLGVILGDKKQVPEAMAQLEEALRLNPEFADAHSNLGALLVGQGRIAEGIEHYQAALRANPNLFVVHLNLGNLLLYQGHLEEAREQLQAAVRLKPAFAEAHGILAHTLLLLGHVPEAVAEYETALRLKPDYPEARAQLEQALQELPSAPSP